MALTLRAMAVGLATAEILLGQRTGKQVFRELEAPDQFELALADLGRLLTFGSNLQFFHLIVIIQ